ncbi:Anaphase-promoting complex subunit 15/MND2 [Penicillium cf. griseofulvum]|uniref:Anaphase-promoting complex subunit 15/MND2 n=1 Tax=Penicillium cf. griseofulvum TaxID=2972120 RepID=A0A9W9J4T1_9EURO|nr:Anaphase-promoting complex subunit 15/MND2 [Penicillium cf. griseofulvum]KAJ5427747.1 Anaphase-promoting complex subunit 15/MND2 [Penicillium cf. griseofulvum]KAJ5431947.1 Anaphase-promoting complex subunit 15/MND2 [Penicillium cf. griseofulvum]
MLTLSSITPRDSHELWFGSSQPYRSTSDQQGDNAAANHLARRNGNGTPSHRSFMPSRSSANTIATLAAEERSLRARKLNIASFGYSWIRPAGCAKTMLGMKEEEAEREEALQAAAAEMEAAEGEGIMDDDTGMQREEIEEDEGMERDLDDDIPNAEEEVSGLIEEGEEGLEEDEIGDEGEYMERDLDDDIPEGFPDDDYEGSDLYDDEDEDDFDNQPDLDAEIPAADGESVSEGMTRDLDDDIPDAAEQGSEQEGEWQHTDSEEELSDEEEENEPSIIQTRFAENFRTSTPNSRGGLPPPPTLPREPETEAQRRFLNRWSGGGDALDSSSMLYSDDDLHASITSQGSRRSGFTRRFPRQIGGPRDSLN